MRNFQVFKYLVLYGGAIIVIIAFLYEIGQLIGFVQWTGEHRTAFSRFWAFVTSKEGVVMWTGLIAVFVLATIIVDRRIEARRAVQWKRRKLRLDHKTARLEKRRPLSGSQMAELSEARRKGFKLHEASVSGGRDGIDDEIRQWESDTSESLKTAVGDEPSDRFLHAPVFPVPMAGHGSATMHRVGRMKARMEVLNEIIKAHSE